MGNSSQNVREWIDFFIAIAAWAVSILAVYTLLRFFVFSHIST
jgi:hypothetical protein